jgi:hypothetical protein
MHTRALCGQLRARNEFNDARLADALCSTLGPGTRCRAVISDVCTAKAVAARVQYSRICA